MKYILLLITLFLSPVYAMLLIVLATKFLSPKVTTKSTELTLLPVPKNMFLISILLDTVVAMYVFKNLTLSQCFILFLIVSCFVLMYTAIRSSKVIYLNGEKGFFTKKKTYPLDQENIKVRISIEYSIEEDKDGMLDELGILQVSLTSENKEIFTNYFKFGKEKYVLKFIQLVDKYKNIDYLINSKEFKTFDDAFTYIVNNSSKDKSLIEKNKDNFIELYNNANPSGDFKNLKIPLNYK